MLNAETAALRGVEFEDAVASDVEAPVEQEEARRGCGSEGEDVMCDSFSTVKMPTLCHYTPDRIKTTKCHTTPREASPPVTTTQYCSHLLSPVREPVCLASSPAQDQDILSSSALRLHVPALPAADTNVREKERKRGKWGTATQLSEGGGRTGGGPGTFAMMQPAQLALVLQGLPLSNILMVCA